MRDDFDTNFRWAQIDLGTRSSEFEAGRFQFRGYFSCSVSGARTHRQLLNPKTPSNVEFTGDRLH